MLAQKFNGLPIVVIRRDDAVGEQIYAAAKALAQDTGKTEADLLTVEETSAARTGHAVREQSAWEAAGLNLQLLGDGTEAGFALVSALDQKIEDYFVRCQLAAFDERASVALNVSEDALKAMAPTALKNSAQAVSDLPLAHVTAMARLSLVGGLNPAWASQVLALRDQVVLPLLGPLPPPAAPRFALGVGAGRMVRLGRYKLIYPATQKDPPARPAPAAAGAPPQGPRFPAPQLFDLASDPYEPQDLSATHPIALRTCELALVAGLSRVVNRGCGGAGAPDPSGPRRRANLTPELLRRLKGLGYTR